MGYHSFLTMILTIDPVRATTSSYVLRKASLNILKRCSSCQNYKQVCLFLHVVDIFKITAAVISIRDTRRDELRLKVPMPTFVQIRAIHGFLFGLSGYERERRSWLLSIVLNQFFMFSFISAFLWMCYPLYAPVSGINKQNKRRVQLMCDHVLYGSCMEFLDVPPTPESLPLCHVPINYTLTATTEGNG